MAFEESPSLELYKEGMPSRLPDPSRKRRILWMWIAGLTILSVGLTFLNMAQSGALAIMTGKGSVSGIVYDEQGNPAVAEVFVFGTDLSTRSDSSGRFVLNGVPAGPQVIVVAYRNIGREYTVQVMVGETVDMGIARFRAEDFTSSWSHLDEIGQ